MGTSKKIIDLAVIIPTLNEEHYIGELLGSLAAQSAIPKEIAVVDAFSEDKTLEKIKAFKKVLPQLKVFQFKRSTISCQRNFGVKKTTSQHILFLDADMYLGKTDSLKKYFEAVIKKSPDLAVVPVMPLSKSATDKLMYATAHIIGTISKPVWPMATSMNMYVNRKIFNKVKGFDEKIKVAEDFDLALRIVRAGGDYQILHSPMVYTSVRRLRAEGRGRFTLKMAKALLHSLQHGYKNVPIEYDFGKHPSID